MQASVDAGDEYAPFLLGPMYISGHIDDEDAGYNGMRFFAIATNRGAEGVENCYCRIDSYVSADGIKQSISAPWLYLEWLWLLLQLLDLF